MRKLSLVVVLAAGLSACAEGPGAPTDPLSPPALITSPAAALAAAPPGTARPAPRVHNAAPDAALGAVSITGYGTPSPLTATETDVNLRFSAVAGATGYRVSAEDTFYGQRKDWPSLAYSGGGVTVRLPRHDSDDVTWDVSVAALGAGGRAGPAGRREITIDARLQTPPPGAVPGLSLSTNGRRAKLIATWQAASGDVNGYGVNITLNGPAVQPVRTAMGLLRLLGEEEAAEGGQGDRLRDLRCRGLLGEGQPGCRERAGESVG